MSKHKYASYLLIIVLFLISCTNNELEIDKTKLPPNDYRLFWGTPAWDLAKAVDDGDEEAIFNIAKANPKILNTLEPIYGYSLLHLSIMNDNLKSFHALINCKADVNIHGDIMGHTPLWTACNYSGRNIECARTLIEAGADVNYVNSNLENGHYYTPLMIACRMGFYDAVKLLVAKGANVNYTTKKGNNAFNESIIGHRYKIAYFLLEHGADYNLPVLTIYDYSKRSLKFDADGFEYSDSIIEIIGIKEEMESARMYYLSKERGYYYKIVDFLNSKGLNIKEAGKRDFDICTFFKEVWTTMR